MSQKNVEELTNAISELKTRQIAELKSFLNPPQLVKNVMSAVAFLLGFPKSEAQMIEEAKKCLGTYTYAQSKDVNHVIPVFYLWCQGVIAEAENGKSTKEPAVKKLAD